LTVKDAAKAISFYEQAFGAHLVWISKTPEGKVMHATLRIGDSNFMLNDEFPEWGGALSPLSTGGSGVTLHIYTEDVDSLFDRAVAAGAQVKMPLMDAFWGSRYGQLTDPFGHHWSLATHTRDMTPAEVDEAAKSALAGK
jgi:uncharacterized glyoxalase superfamily protein PhnB